MIINSRLNRIFGVSFTVLLAVFTQAQDSTIFPEPSGNPNQLFYLQRTPNVNTTVYELNYKMAYWIV